MNISLETVIFNPKKMLGTLDLRLVGYYKIKHGVLQQNLSKYFRFESADVLCDQFNKFVNSLKRENEETINIHGNKKVMKVKTCQTKTY